MSIADMFKIQSAYNQNGTFSDHSNWQDAFKIADAFATTSEKHRANRENLATEDWRVAYQNAVNQSGTAAQQFKLGSHQANNQLADFMAMNAYDKQSGRYRSPEELRSLYTQNPMGLNAQAVMQLDAQNQKYLAGMSQQMAGVSPLIASQYNYMATGNPFIMDDQGNVMNVNNGETLAVMDDPTLRAYFASGNAWKGYEGMLKAQQEAEKAQAIAEARYPYTIGAIEARGQVAQEMQNNRQEMKDFEADLKIASGFIDNVFSMGSNQADQAAQISQLVQTYPHLKEQIGKLVQLKLAQPQY